VVATERRRARPAARAVFGETAPAEAGVEPGQIDPARMRVARARPVEVVGSLCGEYELVAGDELDAEELADLRRSTHDWGPLDALAAQVGAPPEALPGADELAADGDWGWATLLVYDPIRFDPFTDLAAIGGEHWLLRIERLRPGRPR